MVTRTRLTVTTLSVLFKAGIRNTSTVWSSSTWSLFPFKMSAHVARNCRLPRTVQGAQLVPSSLPFLPQYFVPHLYSSLLCHPSFCVQHNSHLTHTSVCSRYTHLATAGGWGFESCKRKTFVSSQIVQTAHFVVWEKRSGREADHSHNSSAALKNEWSHNSSLLAPFTVTTQTLIYIYIYIALMTQGMSRGRRLTD